MKRVTNLFGANELSLAQYLRASMSVSVLLSQTCLKIGNLFLLCSVLTQFIGICLPKKWNHFLCIWVSNLRGTLFDFQIPLVGLIVSSKSSFLLVSKFNNLVFDKKNCALTKLMHHHSTAQEREVGVLQCLDNRYYPGSD